VLAAAQSRFETTQKGTSKMPDDGIPPYDSSDEIICPICSHDEHPHSHKTAKRLTKVVAQGFWQMTESTLLSKHSRGEIPASVTNFPLEFDTCSAAVFKYDRIVVGPFYDRDKHLTILPLALAEQERKRAEKHRKLSEAAKRRRRSKPADSSRPPRPKKR
jgi:uncharacterized Zn finger protein (UPF0148 family)